MGNSPERFQKFVDKSLPHRAYVAHPAPSPKGPAVTPPTDLSARRYELRRGQDRTGGQPQEPVEDHRRANAFDATERRAAGEFADEVERLDPIP